MPALSQVGIYDKVFPGDNSTFLKALSFLLPISSSTASRGSVESHESVVGQAVVDAAADMANKGTPLRRCCDGQATAPAAGVLKHPFETASP